MFLQWVQSHNGEHYNEVAMYFITLQATTYSMFLTMKSNINISLVDFILPTKLQKWHGRPSILTVALSARTAWELVNPIDVIMVTEASSAMNSLSVSTCRGTSKSVEIKTKYGLVTSRRKKLDGGIRKRGIR